MNLIKLTDEYNDPVVINLENVSKILLIRTMDGEQCLFVFEKGHHQIVKESFEEVISRLDDLNPNAFVPEWKQKS